MGHSATGSFQDIFRLAGRLQHWPSSWLKLSTCKQQVISIYQRKGFQCRCVNRRFWGYCETLRAWDVVTMPSQRAGARTAAHRAILAFGPPRMQLKPLLRLGGCCLQGRGALPVAQWHYESNSSIFCRGNTAMGKPWTWTSEESGRLQWLLRDSGTTLPRSVPRRD